MTVRDDTTSFFESFFQALLRIGAYLSTTLRTTFTSTQYELHYLQQSFTPCIAIGRKEACISKDHPLAYELGNGHIIHSTFRDIFGAEVDRLADG